VVSIELLVLGHRLHDLICWSLPRTDAGSGARDPLQGLVGRFPFGLELLVAGSQVANPEPAKDVSVESSSHLRLGSIPPFAEAAQRRLPAPLEKLLLDCVHPALEAEDVLQSVLFKARALLRGRLAAEKILETLVRRRLRKRTATDTRQHLAAGIVGRDRHHCGHEAQLLSRVQI